MHLNDLSCSNYNYCAFKLFIILLLALLGIYMIYYAITRITVHLNDLLCNDLIYYVIIRIIVHLNELLCNYLIYYAIKIISYAPK